MNTSIVQETPETMTTQFGMIYVFLQGEESSRHGDGVPFHIDHSPDLVGLTNL
jgi:hypothetical protein